MKLTGRETGFFRDAHVVQELFRFFIRDSIASPTFRADLLNPGIVLVGDDDRSGLIEPSEQFRKKIDALSVFQDMLEIIEKKTDVLALQGFGEDRNRIGRLLSLDLGKKPSQRIRIVNF